MIGETTRPGRPHAMEISEEITGKGEQRIETLPGIDEETAVVGDVDFTWDKHEKREIPVESIEVLGGEYRILDTLGEGGMGVAYLAVDSDGKKVVIKTWRPDFIVKMRDQEHLGFQETAIKDSNLEEPSAEVPSDIDNDWQMVQKLMNMYSLHQEVGHIQKVQNENPSRHVVKLIGDGTVELSYQGLDIQPIGIVMEYIDGGDLTAMLDENKDNFLAYLNGHKIEYPTDYAQVRKLYDQWIHYSEYFRKGMDKKLLTIAQHVAQGLDAIHKSDLVHQDIKLGNIMARSDGSYAIGDFGIAELMEELAPYDVSLPPTKRGYKRPGSDDDENGKSQNSKMQSVIKQTKPKTTITGTVQYFSPEVLQGYPADAGRDLYALGIILYELRTSKKPFEEQYDKINNPNNNTEERQQYILDATEAHLNQNPPRISETPSDLDRLIETLIQNKPEDRKEFVFQGEPLDVSSAEFLIAVLKKIESTLA